MRLLVTGGAGFIGSHFACLAAPKSNVDVTVVDNLTYAGDQGRIDDVLERGGQLVTGDVCDHDLIDGLVAEHDAVVHFAAESHNDNALDDPARFIQTNIIGTFVVLEAVRNHRKRLLHISTDEVFGDLPLSGDQKFTAQSRYVPSNPYSASKAGADHLVRAWVRSFDVAAMIGICSNNYGPWQHTEKFIAHQITNLLDGHPVQIYGTGANVRDWIHVADHARAVWAMLEHGVPGQTYLIGADNQRSNLSVAQDLVRMMGYDEAMIEFVADRPGHDLRYAIDATTARTELRWRSMIDFRVGLRQTIDWYRDNEPWWRGLAHSEPQRPIQN